MAGPSSWLVSLIDEVILCTVRTQSPVQYAAQAVDGGGALGRLAHAGCCHHARCARCALRRPTLLLLVFVMGVHITGQDEQVG